MKYLPTFESFTTLNEKDFKTTSKMLERPGSLQNKISKEIKKSRGWEILPGSGTNQKYLDSPIFQQEVDRISGYQDPETAIKIATSSADWTNMDTPNTNIVKDEIGFITDRQFMGKPIYKYQISYFVASSAGDYPGKKGVHIQFQQYDGLSRSKAIASFTYNLKYKDQWLDLIKLALSTNDINKWISAVEAESDAKITTETEKLGSNEIYLF